MMGSSATEDRTSPAGSTAGERWCRIADAWPVIERAMKIASARVGDPRALDKNGWPRWLWFVKEAREELMAPAAVSQDQQDA